jgi:hypothetical protein
MFKKTLITIFLLLTPIAYSASDKPAQVQNIEGWILFTSSNAGREAPTFSPVVASAKDCENLRQAVSKRLKYIEMDCVKVSAPLIAK